VSTFPEVRGSWWYDPHVLANYSLLDSHVKKNLPEADFRPLAAFFTAYPAAGHLFGESAQLRHWLKSTPRHVSQVIRACTQFEQLINRMLALTGMPATAASWRPLLLGQEAEALMRPLCGSSVPVSLPQWCPRMEAWRLGILYPAEYNKTLENEAAAARPDVNNWRSRIETPPSLPPPPPDVTTPAPVTASQPATATSPPYASGTASPPSSDTASVAGPPTTPVTASPPPTSDTASVAGPPVTASPPASVTTSPFPPPAEQQQARQSCSDEDDRLATLAGRLEQMHRLLVALFCLLLALILGAAVAAAVLFVRGRCDMDMMPALPAAIFFCKKA
jgi:hypothetical protein